MGDSVFTGPLVVGREFIGDLEACLLLSRSFSLSNFSFLSRSLSLLSRSLSLSRSFSLSRSLSRSSLFFLSLSFISKWFEAAAAADVFANEGFGIFIVPAADEDDTHEDVPGVAFTRGASHGAVKAGEERGNLSNGNKKTATINQTISPCT